MKKLLLFLILVVLLSASFALAAPPWKKDKDSDPAPTTTIIVQNITASPQEGVDWEQVGAIVAIFAVVGAVVGWLLTRRKKSKASHYIKDISEIFNKYKNDTGKCEAELYSMKEQIESDFARGKISDESFNMLDSRIDRYMRDVRKGIITTFDLSSKQRKELHEMLKDSIITDEEYKEFSKMDLKHLPKAEKAKLDKLMKKWKSKSKKK